MKTVVDKATATNIGNCGILFLTELGGVRNDLGGTTKAQVIVSNSSSMRYEYYTTEKAIIKCLWDAGYRYSDPKTYADVPYELQTLENMLTLLSGLCWTDSDHCGNGAALKKFFTDKGYVVHETVVGHNKRYASSVGSNHFLRHYVAILNSKVDDPKTASKVTEYTYAEQEKNNEESTVSEVPSNQSGVILTRIRKLRAAAGTGVRTSGQGVRFRRHTNLR